MKNILKFYYIIEAIAGLFLAWLLLRISGVKAIKRKRQCSRTNTLRVRSIFENVSKVSHYFPVSCRCLEVAFAVKLISNMHSLKAELIMGVSLGPFIAHAWIRSEDCSFGINNTDKYNIIGVF